MATMKSVNYNLMHCVISVYAELVYPARAGAASMLLAEKVLLVVLLLGLAVSHSNSQECGETNVRSRGAAGNGRQNDSQFFRVMDGDPAAGLIYMSDGTYRISESLVINKPIMGSEKAVFLVDAGCVLMLVNQPEHPLTTFFRGKLRNNGACQHNALTA